MKNKLNIQQFTRQLWEAALRDTKPIDVRYKIRQKSSLREDQGKVDSGGGYNENLSIEEKKEWLINFFKKINYNDLTYIEYNDSYFLIYPKSKTAQLYLRDYYKVHPQSGVRQVGDNIHGVLPVYFNRDNEHSLYARRINSINGIPQFLKGIALGAKCYLAATKIYGYVVSTIDDRSAEAERMWESLERYALRTGDFVLINLHDDTQILAQRGSGLKNAIKEFKFNYDDIIPQRSVMPAVYAKYLKKISSEYRDKYRDWDDYNSYGHYDYYDNEENTEEDTPDEEEIAHQREYEKMTSDWRYKRIYKYCNELTQLSERILTTPPQNIAQSLPSLSYSIYMYDNSSIKLDKASKIFQFPKSPMHTQLKIHNETVQKLVRNISHLYRELQSQYNQFPLPEMHFRGIRVSIMDLQLGLIGYLFSIYGDVNALKLFFATQNPTPDIMLFKKMYMTGTENKTLNPKYMARIVSDIIRGDIHFSTNSQVIPYLKLAPDVYELLPDKIKNKVQLV